MPSDSELLRDYVRDGSEAAIAELVRRYAGLVYSAALRLVGDKADLAEDVSQEVFILLARKAPRLVGREALAAWLYTCTRHVAFRALRARRRREIREQEAATMQTHAAPETPWKQLRPQLDEAMAQLNERDRQAVLLRYFQGWSHREVGAALGQTEDAARVRVDRAVEKLSRYFARSGIITSAALLAEVLVANSVQAAPADFVGKATSASLAGAKELGLGHALFQALYMTTTTKIILTAAALGAAFAVGWSGAKLAVIHASQPARSAAGGRSTLTKNSTLSPADALAKAKSDLAKILRLRGTYDREQALLALVAGLDVKTLQGLLASLKPEVTGNNTQAMSILLGQWAESDPQAALDSLKGLHDAFARGLATSIFDAWSAKDPAAALAAIAQLPEGEARGDALRAVIENMIAQNPQSALSALLSPQIEGYSTEVAEYLFGELASVNPSATAAAALAGMTSVFSSPTTLNTVTADVAQNWLNQDPNAATQWINTLPPGAPRDNAVEQIISTVGQSDPASAFTWALSIGGQNIRNAQVVKLATQWASQNPAAAAAAQNALGNLTGLTPAQQTALQNIAAKAPTP